MTHREGKEPSPDERERLARILTAAFPVGGAGSFTSLLQALDPPPRKRRP